MLFLYLLTIPFASAFNVSLDSNIRQESGFVAYRVEKPDDYTDYALITLSMILSTVIPNYMSGLPGFAYASVIGMGGFSYAARHSWDDPQTAYQQIWGKIETSINNRIIAKSVSKLKDQLRTLSINLQDTVDRYMAELGATNQTEMIEMKTGFNVSATLVDSHMKAIDNLLSASTQFYTYTPVDVMNPEYFVLVNAGPIGKKRCLHTEKQKIDDGALVVLDEDCDLNSLADKLWSVDGNDRLVLRTAAGDKCLSYVTKTWTFQSSLKRPLAVYDLNTKQCIKGRALKLKRRPGSNGFSLYDGSRMICAQPSKIPRSNYLVTREKGNKCIGNNTLEFRSKIPIPMTSTRGVLVPAMSLDEIYVQMNYMPTIANLHLASLKEMYLHGTQTIFAAVQFNSKVQEYAGFLSSNLPIFAEYALFKGFKARDQIKTGIMFADQLQNATLSFSPSTIMFPKQS